VVDLGIAHLAVPLLVDGCKETAVEIDELLSMMRLHESEETPRTQSYVPLLRVAERLFDPGILDALLCGELQSGPCGRHGDDAVPPLLGTEAIAMGWLRAGGKRFRPFVTLAAYAAVTLGEAALHPDADLSDAFPEVVQRAAVAVESLHKASLVHDDIEDNDAFRYGVETLHRRYGVATAVNVGDYLVGLGYRLLAGGADELGPTAVADVLGVLSRAHVRLSRGQGAELLWREHDPRTVRPLDLLAVYALKTAPAFEAAMYIGLRAAGEDTSWRESVTAYCRYLGVAYQVLNDLKDWRRDTRDKLLAGQDLFSARPTVLLAFALESGGPDGNKELVSTLRDGGDEEARFERLRGIYASRGVFEKADALIEKYRARALAAAAGIKRPALAELMRFIVDVVLR
jgi:geranylgeranyl pyrophosphate synthase